MRARDIYLVVVTGAGSGIGRATALRFARDHALVVCLDIDEGRARATAELISERGGIADAFALDVADAVAYAALAEKVRRKHGIADVVVNNAGVVAVGDTMAHSVEDWNRVLGVNLSGVIHGCRLFGAQMSERGEGGHLVNIASAAAFGGAAVAPSYCVSKAAVRMFSESLRAELASEGIGVSVICPGVIHTNLMTTASHLTVDDAKGAERNEQALSLSRLASQVGLVASPDAVATAIVRAVHHNWAVVPVKPEAWALYGLSRLSPELVRFGARYATGQGAVDAASRVGELPGVGALLRRFAPA